MKHRTLQELRKNKNLTQEQVAKILTISVQYLSMLENGIRNPSDTLKQKMAKLYGCDIADIFLTINSTKCLMTKPCKKIKSRRIK